MKPAPPVTIARLLTRGNLYGRSRGGAGEQIFDRFDADLHRCHGLSTRMSPRSRGRLATDGGAAED